MRSRPTTAVRFSIVASSDLSRASETAAIIAGALGLTDVISDDAPA